MQRPTDSILHILQDSRLALDIEPSSLVESRIQSYLDLLVKWNHKINLTAEKDPDSILKRHVFDSLQYSRALRPDSRVMDIGSGAGFPGIPLKIIFPELKLVLVESQRKRCSFMETAVRELGLDQTEVVNVRAEDIPAQREGQFDAVIFRAVSGLKPCLTLGERFMAPAGRLIVKKPPDESSAQQESSLTLKDDIAITSYQGLVSSLLVYEKCST
ncbi:MAG: 16S rRNA (guanine(527)-N(7))-methyltransferase RsmG [Nitrospinae bacterium]|nr:16S rRNA (guanine(527)-N(7))-methyltransferase RsmG [Nitrospinota bacterium]MBL7021378.1 16S rRNA (guanine(527)-N(7))-methyltransferase RsmG [Nitrospinaceae bacterium]